MVAQKRRTQTESSGLAKWKAEPGVGKKRQPQFAGQRTAEEGAGQKKSSRDLQKRSAEGPPKHLWLST